MQSLYAADSPDLEQAGVTIPALDLRAAHPGLREHVSANCVHSGSLAVYYSSSKSWEHRWCVLDPATLWLFTGGSDTGKDSSGSGSGNASSSAHGDSDGSDMVGSITLDSHAQASSISGCEFELFAGTRCCVFRAGSEAEAAAWVLHLHARTVALRRSMRTAATATGTSSIAPVSSMWPLLSENSLIASQEQHRQDAGIAELGLREEPRPAVEVMLHHHIGRQRLKAFARRLLPENVPMILCWEHIQTYKVCHPRVQVAFNSQSSPRPPACYCVPEDAMAAHLQASNIIQRFFSTHGPDGVAVLPALVNTLKAAVLPRAQQPLHPNRDGCLCHLLPPADVFDEVQQQVEAAISSRLALPYARAAARRGTHRPTAASTGASAVAGRSSAKGSGGGSRRRASTAWSETTTSSNTTEQRAMLSRRPSAPSGKLTSMTSSVQNSRTLRSVSHSPGAAAANRVSLPAPRRSFGGPSASGGSKLSTEVSLLEVDAEAVMDVRAASLSSAGAGAAVDAAFADATAGGEADAAVLLQQRLLQQQQLLVPADVDVRDMPFSSLLHPQGEDVLVTSEAHGDAGFANERLLQAVCAVLPAATNAWATAWRTTIGHYSGPLLGVSHAPTSGNGGFVHPTVLQWCLQRQGLAPHHVAGIWPRDATLAREPSQRAVSSQDGSADAPSTSATQILQTADCMLLAPHVGILDGHSSAVVLSRVRAAADFARVWRGMSEASAEDSDAITAVPAVRIAMQDALVESILITSQLLSPTPTPVTCMRYTPAAQPLAEGAMQPQLPATTALTNAQYAAVFGEPRRSLRDSPRGTARGPEWPDWCATDMSSLLLQDGHPALAALLGLSAPSNNGTNAISNSMLRDTASDDGMEGSSAGSSASTASLPALFGCPYPPGDVFLPPQQLTQHPQRHKRLQRSHATVEASHGHTSAVPSGSSSCRVYPVPVVARWCAWVVGLDWHAAAAAAAEIPEGSLLNVSRYGSSLSLTITALGAQQAEKQVLVDTWSNSRSLLRQLSAAPAPSQPSLQDCVQEAEGLRVGLPQSHSPLHRVHLHLHADGMLSFWRVATEDGPSGTAAAYRDPAAAAFAALQRGTLPAVPDLLGHLYLPSALDIRSTRYAHLPPRSVDIITVAGAVSITYCEDVTGGRVVDAAELLAWFTDKAQHRPDTAHALLLPPNVTGGKKMRVQVRVVDVGSSATATEGGVIASNSRKPLPLLEHIMQKRGKIHTAYKVRTLRLVMTPSSSPSPALSLPGAAASAGSGGAALEARAGPTAVTSLGSRAAQIATLADLATYLGLRHSTLVPSVDAATVSPSPVADLIAAAAAEPAVSAACPLPTALLRYLLQGQASSTPNAGAGAAVAATSPGSMSAPELRLEYSKGDVLRGNVLLWCAAESRVLDARISAGSGSSGGGGSHGIAAPPSPAPDAAPARDSSPVPTKPASRAKRLSAFLRGGAGNTAGKSNGDEPATPTAVVEWQLRTPDRTWQFLCDDPSVAAMWLAALHAFLAPRARQVSLQPLSKATEAAV